jgi:hypothetical protein
VDLTSRLQKHDLQTLQAKTPFLSACVERCGCVEQGSQNGDFALDVRRIRDTLTKLNKSKTVFRSTGTERNADSM